MLYCTKCLSNIRKVKQTNTIKHYSVNNDGTSKKSANKTDEEIDEYFECDCHTLEEDVEFWNKNGLEGMV